MFAQARKQQRYDVEETGLKDSTKRLLYIKPAKPKQFCGKVQKDCHCPLNSYTNESFLDFLLKVVMLRTLSFIQFAFRKTFRSFASELRRTFTG